MKITEFVNNLNASNKIEYSVYSELFDIAADADDRIAELEEENERLRDAIFNIDPQFAIESGYAKPQPNDPDYLPY